MPSYVCSGAKLKCSMGDSPSDLKVLHVGKTVSLGDNFMATIMDNKPMMNIMPFGQCQSILNPMVAAATAASFGVLRPMPCIPNIAAPWMNGKMDVLVKGHPALLDCSKLMCAWAGMIEITDDGQGSNKMTTGASRVEIEPIPETPKCLVLFRPHENYEGEYGFDWIRKADEKIETKRPNLLRGNDVDTEKLLGKYLSTDCQNRCRLSRHCQDTNRNIDNVCLDINGWSTNFERDKDVPPPSTGFMFRDAKCYFDFMAVSGFVSRGYHVPVLTVMPGEERKAKLLMMVCIKDEPFDSDFLRFEYNMDVFKLDPDPTTLVTGDITDTPNDLTKWQRVEFDLECLKEFSEDEYINVYCNSPEKGVENYLCGKLRILANDISHCTIEKVVFVEVTADIGNRRRTGKFSSNDIITLENVLRQGYVFMSKDIEIEKYPQVELNLAPWITEFKNNHVDNSTNPRTIKDDNNRLLRFLNEKLDYAYNNTYRDYIKIYSINEEFPGIAGFSVPGETNACIVFEGSDADTVPHELLHSLYLEHTFTHKDVAKFFPDVKNALFTYEAMETDNVMDYSHIVGMRVKSTFYWQWIIINKNISR